MPAAEQGRDVAPGGRLVGLPGDGLLARYLFGSAACGGYRPGRSDLGVQGVTARALSVAQKRAVNRLRGREALRHPGKGLALMLYRRRWQPGRPPRHRWRRT
ncbi:MAG: hypothetical protein ABIJ48_07450 [Actinomycetota bacterium]